MQITTNLDPIVVVYRFKSGRINKAIPFSSGDCYVLAVRAANPRSDVDLTTVEETVEYESEAMDQNIEIIGYADNTDYDEPAITSAQRALGWIGKGSNTFRAAYIPDGGGILLTTEDQAGLSDDDLIAAAQAEADAIGAEGEIVIGDWRE